MVEGFALCDAEIRVGGKSGRGFVALRLMNHRRGWNGGKWAGVVFETKVTVYIPGKAGAAAERVKKGDRVMVVGELRAARYTAMGSGRSLMGSHLVVIGRRVTVGARGDGVDAGDAGGCGGAGPVSGVTETGDGGEEVGG